MVTTFRKVQPYTVEQKLKHSTPTITNDILDEQNWRKRNKAQLNQSHDCRCKEKNVYGIGI
jgi:hypothetical protein